MKLSTFLFYGALSMGSTMGLFFGLRNFSYLLNRTEMLVLFLGAWILLTLSLELNKENKEVKKNGRKME